MHSLCSALALSLVLAIPTSAQLTIDTGLPPTPGPISGPTVGGPFDSPEYWIVSGQVFTTPTLDDILLTTFSFGMCCTSGSFEAYAFIQEWSGSGTTGDVLYAGGLASSVGTTPVGSSTSWHTWDIGGGGLALKTNTQYIAFLTGDLTSSEFAFDGLLNVGGDSYSGGGYAQTIMSSNSLPPAGDWDYVRSNDVAFTAEFATVPEPATVILLATGLLGLGIVAWRRREREA